MALKLNINVSVIPECIRRAQGIKDDNIALYLRLSSQGIARKVHFTLSYYQMCEANDEIEIDDYSIINQPIEFTPDTSDDIFLQGYNYLKTLPEFKGCEDC